MQRLIILLLSLSMFSCKYIETKKVYTKELYIEELNSFNWNEVDIYPLFEDCRGFVKEENSKTCFYNTFSNSINTYLKTQNITTSQEMKETVLLVFEINNRGEVYMKSLQSPENVKLLIPNLDSILNNGLKQLPKIYPATKRGQEVTAVFKLPISIMLK